MQLRSQKRLTEDVVCTGRCGVSLIDKRPYVSFDASTCFIPSGSIIRQFSLATGEPLKLLRFHDTFVVAIVPYGLNRVQCLSCSVDGKLFRWDTLDATLLSEYKINLEDTKIQVFLGSLETPYFAYVTHKKVDGVACNTFLLGDLNELNETPFEISTSCSSNSSHFAMATHSDLLAWIEQEAVHVMHCSKPTVVEKFKLRVKPSCICVHPRGEIVAIGDNDGAIHVHSTPFNQTAMKLHWHTLAVADLYFTANFLYSVGTEGVLVKWNLESDDRQFLPRLGMPIKFIAVGQSEKNIVTSHTDNTLTVVAAPSTVQAVIQGLIQRSYSGDTPSDLGILFDPRSGHLVGSGRPGQLQFYNLELNRQSLVIDVTGENYATDFKLQYQLMKGINSEVILADFTADGNYLVTVDFKSALSTMSKLKFWRWSDEKSEYEINTSILMPHIRARIRACKIGCRDGRYFCVTAADKCFKVWTIVEGGDSQFWQCIDEKEFRQFSCNTIAISEDASLVAVSFAHMITLWQVDLDDVFEPLGDFCVKGEQQHITSMEFGRGSTNNILMTTTSKAVSGWDIFALDRAWTHEIQVKQLIPDPNSENFAAIVTKPNRNVVIFHPENGFEEPVAEIETGQDDVIRCGVFVPRTFKRGHCEKVKWQKQSTLFVMGKRDKLFNFVLRKNATAEEQEPSNDMVDASVNVESLMTPFGSHLIATAERKADYDEQSFAVQAAQIDTGKVVQKIIQTPSHVLPSPWLMVEPLLRSFAGLELQSVEEPPVAQKMEVVEQPVAPGDSDDDDDDSDSGVVAIKRARIVPLTDKDPEKDLLETIRKLALLDKVKLPKIKDYLWIAPKSKKKKIA